MYDDNFAPNDCREFVIIIEESIYNLIYAFDELELLSIKEVYVVVADENLLTNLSSQDLNLNTYFRRVLFHH